MPVMTWKKLGLLIDSGRGSGHGDDYQPWLWVRRKNASKKSNQVVATLPGYRRGTHFLARVEWHVALLCLYLGAMDVREQFPMWPMEHMHPLAELHSATGRRDFAYSVPGLWEIAKDAGISHGYEVGSRGVPYVATLDLALTLKRSGRLQFSGISLKPHSEISGAAPSSRMLERLELERLYLQNIGANYRILDVSILGKHTGANLEIFASGARLPTHLTNSSRLREFAFRMTQVARNTSIDEGIRRTARELRLSQVDASVLWRHSVWVRAIDLDITEPLEPGRPLPAGNPNITTYLERELFGAIRSWT